jgi:hypothetical protein
MGGKKKFYAKRTVWAPGTTHNITVDERSYSVKRSPDVTVLYLDEYTGKKKKKKHAKFSGKKQYRCKAKKLFGKSACEEYCCFPAYGVDFVHVTCDGAEVGQGFLCKNCQHVLELLGDEEMKIKLVGGSSDDKPYQRVPLPTSGGNGPDTEAMLYKNSCANLARDVSMMNEVFITKANPPPSDQVDGLGKVLFPVERKGGRRGSKHRSAHAGDFQGVYKALYDCSAVKEVWDATIKADGVGFYYVIPVLYRDGNGKD